MKELVIVGMLLFTTTILHGQNIVVGQDAYEIAAIIESSMDRHKRIEPEQMAGKYWTWEIEYFKEQISQVIQCYSNEYIRGLGRVSYFCRHYMMSKGRLSYISTRFSDIDSATISKYFKENFGEYKIGQFYFSSDYNYYFKIKETRTRHAVVEWRVAEWNDLSPEIQDTITNRLLEQSEGKPLDSKVENAQRQREIEIKSKTYDLQIHDSAGYRSFVNDLRLSLIAGLKNDSKFPEWDQVENELNKCFIFKNTYNALYRIYDHSNFGKDSRFILLPEDGVFEDQNHFELVRGDDTICDFLAYYSPSLPSIKKEGYSVMTDARITDIDVLFMKGITHVKVKDGKVTYLKYNPPPEVRKETTRDLKKLENGKYEVKYESGIVMDSTFTITEPTKMSTVAGTIFTVIGVAIMSVIVYAADPPE